MKRSVSVCIADAGSVGHGRCAPWPYHFGSRFAVQKIAFVNNRR